MMPAMPTAPTTLTYWNGRGLCESIRFMLAFTGEAYEEAVPGFEGVTHLSQPEHLKSMRDQGLLLFGQVPLLRIDGLNLVQSKAIIRYLAEKHCVCGSNPALKARADMLAEGIDDLRTSMGRAFEFNFGAYAQTAEQKQRTADACDKYLPCFERALAHDAGPYLVENSPVFVDVLLFDTMDQLLTAGHAEAFAAFPCLQAHRAGMLDASTPHGPRLQAFLDSDLRKSKTQDGIEGYKASVQQTMQRVI
eukprot:CAMPEP_0184103222 /NCGR_PEP_ID=MMETSP0974-20121125/13741_1 /TAXON_ID=483370 /ORGANISM="non described non described, Strain CCMP2097" /LENGTH=247 /DNA_ID=CAMNT_0026406183 /DNA_START=106 /DNA_END=849 /DNA_ORIENTATION=+